MTTYAVVDPVTGRTIREYPEHSDHLLATKVDRAAATYGRWGMTTNPGQRAGLLRQAAHLFIERREHLASIISAEMGKPVSQGVLEVDFAAAILEYYAERAEALLADELLPLADGSGTALIRRESFGVLLGVMPWNYPYYQVARFAAPNLMVGNTILLKHSHQCPESAAALEALFLDAGFPLGAYENVYASSAQINAIVADPRLRGVAVVGREPIGAQAAEAAGRHLKKVVLELGSSEPFVVLSSDDLDSVVAAATRHFSENSGQHSGGAGRFIVIGDLYEAFLAKLTKAASRLRPGDPAIKETLVGPLSSDAAAAHLEKQLRRAIEHGARVAQGGSRDGSFFEPTILVDIDPDNPVSREGFYGPFANVYRATSEDHAIDLANATPFGLASYLFTTDRVQASRVAKQLKFGVVYINLFATRAPESSPLQHRKNPYLAADLERDGIGEFINRKVIRSAS